MYVLLKYMICIISLPIMEWSLGFSTEGELGEYCQSEEFKPMCPNGEVIVMREAKYGHIKLGRCIDKDYGDLGCYLDQLGVMDRKCSGRKMCEVFFSDMDGEFPCSLSKALARYLEASFICQKVFRPANAQCSGSIDVSAGSRYNYLSSKSAKDYHCGGDNHPWVVQATEGQKINMSFIDFNWKVNSMSESAINCPVKYGYILDEESNNIVNLCGELTRERNLYISKGHRSQVLIDKNILDRVNFLIGYKAIGCPKYKTLPDTWTKERDGYIIVGCTATSDQWKMRCIGTHWLGPVKDCSKYVPDDLKIKTAQTIVDNGGVLNMPSAVAFALFGGIFLIILSIALTTVVGIFCVRKSNIKSKHSADTTSKPPLLLPLDSFPTYKSVGVKIARDKNITSSALSDNPFGSINTLPSLGSVPRRPPSLRESPHYYLLEGRETPETEPLYDVVYQGLPTQVNA